MGEKNGKGHITPVARAEDHVYYGFPTLDSHGYLAGGSTIKRVAGPPWTNGVSHREMGIQRTESPPHGAIRITGGGFFSTCGTAAMPPF